MEKYQYVTPEYDAQLKELAETLVTPERFQKPEIVLVHMTPEQFMGMMASVNEVEGCPPDEAYPRCDNCEGCGR
jgi:hypothetical protein